VEAGGGGQPAAAALISRSAKSPRPGCRVVLAVKSIQRVRPSGAFGRRHRPSLWQNPAPSLGPAGPGIGDSEFCPSEKPDSPLGKAELLFSFGSPTKRSPPFHGTEEKILRNNPVRSSIGLESCLALTVKPDAGRQVSETCGTPRAFRVAGSAGDRGGRAKIPRDFRFCATVPASARATHATQIRTRERPDRHRL
jgi:hypothetical protein